MRCESNSKKKIWKGDSPPLPSTSPSSLLFVSPSSPSPFASSLQLSFYFCCSFSFSFSTKFSYMKVEKKVYRAVLVKLTQGPGLFVEQLEDVMEEVLHDTHRFDGDPHIRMHWMEEKCQHGKMTSNNIQMRERGGKREKGQIKSRPPPERARSSCPLSIVL